MICNGRMGHRRWPFCCIRNGNILLLLVDHMSTCD
jgi:hypothetical protein